MSTSIDVVIPTLGNWNLTERCLEHLRAQTISHSVIVVDNGSSDDTATNVRQSFSEVKLLELGANMGFSVACNRGVRSSDGEVVVLLNNDVFVRPGFLESLVAPFSDPAVGSAAPLLLQSDERTIDCVGLTVDRTLAGYARLRGRPSTDATASVPTIVGPLGGAAAYRRTAWEGVGGLDEGLFFYGEDTDLAIRVRGSGWMAVAVPDAVAVHVGSSTAGTRTSWQRFHSGFGRGYVARRYGLLTSPVGPRLLLTEAIVVAGDAAMNRDLAALRGRIAGWNAGGSRGLRPMPSAVASDPSIGFAESLKLRWSVYEKTSRASPERASPEEPLSRARRQ